MMGRKGLKELRTKLASVLFAGGNDEAVRTRGTTAATQNRGPGQT